MERVNINRCVNFKNGDGQKGGHKNLEGIKCMFMWIILLEVLAT